MQSSTLLSIGAIKHPVRKNLASLYQLELLETSFADYLDRQSHSEKLAGVVIDWENENSQNRDRQIVETSLENNLPVLLLNIKNSDRLADIIGLGFKSECAIVKKLNGNTVIEVLDLSEQDSKWEESQVTVNNDPSNAPDSETLASEEQKLDTEVKSITLTTEPPAPEDFAAFIEQKLSSDASEAQPTDTEPEIEQSDPGDLPAGQAKTLYVRINRSAKIRNKQTFRNELTMVVTILASFNNPPYKFLRITSLGAGFSPGDGKNIYSDSEYDRGFFQSKIDVNMTSMSNELTALLTNPQNVNNVSTYTTSSEIQVGVDVSKNPGFNGSYTIGERHSQPISDFDIQNRSSGSKGSWRFQLSETKNSIWDMFEEPLLKKARVKKLPNLAKLNLQPTCSTIWYTPNTYNGKAKIQFNWSAEYHRCYVTGNWANYTKHWERNTFNWGYWQNNPWSINFGVVNPNGSQNRKLAEAL